MHSQEDTRVDSLPTVLCNCKLCDGSGTMPSELDRTKVSWCACVIWIEPNKLQKFRDKGRDAVPGYQELLAEDALAEKIVEPEGIALHHVDEESSGENSDGSTANYYILPEGATQLQDLISFKNMNAQIGEIQRAVYRYGQCGHSDKMRELRKMKFYVEAEMKRIERYESTS